MLPLYANDMRRGRPGASLPLRRGALPSDIVAEMRGPSLSAIFDPTQRLHHFWGSESMEGQQARDAIAEWNARGVLTLPRFYADAEIDAVVADYRALWNEGRARVTVDDMDIDRRMRLRDVSADAQASHRFKVNDLYLEQASVHRLALNDRLVPLAAATAGRTPCGVQFAQPGIRQRAGRPCRFTLHDAAHAGPSGRGLGSAGRLRAGIWPAALLARQPQDRALRFFQRRAPFHSRRAGRVAKLDARASAAARIAKRTVRRPQGRRVHLEQ